MVASERFAVAAGDDQAVRVSLGGLLSRERLERALQLLHAHLVSGGARAGLLI